METNKESANQKVDKTEKWYDIQNLVDMMLFVFPPAGLYGLFKSDKLLPRPAKIIAGLAVFGGIVWILISKFTNN